MFAMPISWVPLDAADVAELPPRLKDRLAPPVAPVAESEWVLAHAVGWGLGDMVARVNRLVALQEDAGVSLDRQLDRALEWLVGTGSSVEAEIALDNLELRRDYLAETPTLTAAQIHRLSGLKSRNTSEPASRWKAEGKTFAVRVGRRDQYPAFQFQDGAPRPAIKTVLAALPQTMTAWQKALWFASANGWLDGDEPQARLDDSELVADAARQLREVAVG